MLAPNFALLMLGRILQGSATGIATPLMFNLIVERIPRNKIGFYMGLSGLVWTRYKPSSCDWSHLWRLYD